MKKIWLASPLIAIICGGVGTYLIFHHHAELAKAKKRLVALSHATDVIHRLQHDSLPEDTKDDLDREYRSYKQKRYREVLTRIESAKGSGADCWMPVTAFAGKDIENGYWVFGLDWIDSSYRVRGLSLYNKGGTIATIRFSPPDARNLATYNSSAYHYAQFELQNREGAAELLRAYVWPHQGLIAMRIAAIDKSLMVSLVGDDGRYSDGMSVYVVLPGP